MSSRSSGKTYGMNTAVNLIQDVAGKQIQLSRKKAIAVMKKICQMVLKKAKYYCPKDTKALVKSGRYEVSVKGGVVVGEVSFGSDEAYYALWVHEDKTKYHSPPTQSHFLQQAYEDLEYDIDELLDTLVE